MTSHIIIFILGIVFGFILCCYGVYLGAKTNSEINVSPLGKYVFHSAKDDKRRKKLERITSTKNNVVIVNTEKSH